ncbi:MAG: serine/threonine-protein phosphatase [Opitutales bacterium]|nr:serine/threonine-protein phosphatase [Opitutales bacterium]
MTLSFSKNKSQTVQWSGMTHVGRVRKNNEDAFLGITFDDKECTYLGKIGEERHDRGDFIFAVSDGMGGANAGEFASKVAVEKLMTLAPSSFRLATMGITVDYADILDEVFSEIHKKICSYSFHYEECRGMGATLSMCWLTPEYLYFAHIGDSRIYYLPKEGELKQLTEDHSVAWKLMREGKITEREARKHPEKSILLKSLGAIGDNIEPQFGSVRYEDGDRFIICSDGISDALFDSDIRETLRRPLPYLVGKPPAERLVKKALREGGLDNLTAVVVEIHQP